MEYCYNCNNIIEEVEYACEKCGEWNFPEIINKTKLEYDDFAHILYVRNGIGKLYPLICICGGSLLYFL